MIRVVPTGDIGFDAILGGGWRLVERLPGRESATVVLRGGPGSGKTLLSMDVARALAKALNGDVIVACVELLPSEYSAQVQAGRLGLNMPWSEPVILLPRTESVPPSKLPRIFCGLLPELDYADPDLVAGLESLQRDVVALGGKPAVVVVDSLIAGYGIGATLPREHVDAVMKFAAQQGLGLVLCEETIDETSTAWDFAVDTVIVLDQQRAGGRRIRVQKHRFGPSATGEHQFQIHGRFQPRVYPRPDAWSDAKWDAEHYPWSSGLSVATHLRWIDQSTGEARDYACSLAVVAAPDLSLVRRLALGLVPVDSDAERDIVVELRLAPNTYRARGSRDDVLRLPIADGVDAIIQSIVVYLGRELADKERDRPRRIVIGDLGIVGAFQNPEEWAEGIRVVAALVAGSICPIPVIVYDSTPATPNRPRVLDVLRWQADLLIEAKYDETGHVAALITSRRDGTVEKFRWPAAGPWRQAG